MKHFSKVLLAFVLIFQSLHASPLANVFNRDKVIECVIDTREQKKTGVFIWLFSNELDTGHRDILGGMKGVDYKIEDSTLSRYVHGQESSWQTVANLKKRDYGPWQIYTLPKSLFLKPEGKLKWRLVLFPRDKKKPLFLPKAAPAVMDLKQSLNIPALNTEGIAVEYFTKYPKAENTPEWLGYRTSDDLSWTFGEAIPEQFAAKPELFNAPAKFAIWWPEMKGEPKDILTRDGVLGSRLAKSSKSLIFAPIHTESKAKEIILNARVKATLASGRSCYFYAKTAEDVPIKATGIILQMSDTLKETVVAWKDIRKKYEGPLWFPIDASFWKLSENEQNLFIQSWLFFKVYLLLSPELNVEELTHEKTRFLIWQRLHIDEMLAGHKSFEKMLPMPTDTKTRRLWRKRQYAYEYYLKDLNDDMRESFFAAVKDGS